MIHGFYYAKSEFKEFEPHFKFKPRLRSLNSASDYAKTNIYEHNMNRTKVLNNYGSFIIRLHVEIEICNFLFSHALQLLIKRLEDTDHIFYFLLLKNSKK